MDHSFDKKKNSFLDNLPDPINFFCLFLSWKEIRTFIYR